MLSAFQYKLGTKPLIASSAVPTCTFGLVYFKIDITAYMQATKPFLIRYNTATKSILPWCTTNTRTKVQRISPACATLAAARGKCCLLGAAGSLSHAARSATSMHSDPPIVMLKPDAMSPVCGGCKILLLLFASAADQSIKQFTCSSSHPRSRPRFMTSHCLGPTQFHLS